MGQYRQQPANEGHALAKIGAKLNCQRRKFRINKYTGLYNALPAMKRRTFLYLNLLAAIIVYLFLEWQTKTPNTTPAPAKASAKPIAAQVNFKMPQFPKAPIFASAAGENSSASLDTSATPNNGTAAEGKSQHDNAWVRAHYPLLPDKVYLAVPLDQAEHHVFKINSPWPGRTVEASIVGFHHSIPKGMNIEMEFVDLYIWAIDGVPPWYAAGGVVMQQDGNPLHSFSPQDQDYIRNWAQQQAMANPAATALTSSGLPTFAGLVQAADRLGISRESPDWMSQVEAQMTARDMARAAAVPEPVGLYTGFPMGSWQQGPTVILNQ
jgi:hypothetical protein